MIENNIIKKIKNAPIEDRLQIIDDILQSLKTDISMKSEKKKHKPFVIREISLGEEVHVDRDDVYSERN